jgi:hypothetical protein
MFFLGIGTTTVFAVPTSVKLGGVLLDLSATAASGCSRSEFAEPLSVEFILCAIVGLELETLKFSRTSLLVK